MDETIWRDKIRKAGYCYGRFKGKILLTLFVVMLPAFIGILLWNKLPNQIATHLGYNGEPNGYSSKFFAVLGLPLILLACHVLCTVITKLDPKKQNISENLIVQPFSLQSYAISRNSLIPVFTI